MTPPLGADAQSAVDAYQARAHACEPSTDVERVELSSELDQLPLTSNPQSPDGLTKCVGQFGDSATAHRDAPGEAGQRRSATQDVDTAAERLDAMLCSRPEPI